MKKIKFLTIVWFAILTFSFLLGIGISQGIINIVIRQEENRLDRIQTVVECIEKTSDEEWCLNNL